MPPDNEQRVVKLTKLEAATRQLDTAIRLFFEGDYLSSLTLAGAAEEILGSLSRRAGKQTAIAAIAAHHRNDTDPNLSDEQHAKVISTVANRPRNAAKHANDPDEDGVEVDPAYALQMIMRAMPMHHGLGVTSTELMNQMNEWIRAHPEATR
jgi:hypothetical protein